MQHIPLLVRFEGYDCENYDKYGVYCKDNRKAGDEILWQEDEEPSQLAYFTDTLANLLESALEKPNA